VNMPPGYQPVPPRKRHTLRTVLISIAAVFGVLIVIGIIGAALGGGKTTGNSGHPAAGSAATTPAASPSALSPGDAAFVAGIRSALSTGGFTNTSSDAQIAHLGDTFCSVLKAGGSPSTVAAVLSNKKAENGFNMPAAKVISLAHSDICPQTKVAPSYTVAQQQAITAAKGYLSMGQGFSKAGLIDQLSSPDGNGFSLKLARFAVEHVKVNWRQQAVIAARGYMSLGEGFSYSGLVEQLDSPDGGQFTVAQAEYAARKVGL